MNGENANGSLNERWHQIQAQLNEAEGASIAGSTPEAAQMRQALDALYSELRKLSQNAEAVAKMHPDHESK